MSRRGPPPPAAPSPRASRGAPPRRGLCKGGNGGGREGGREGECGRSDRERKGGGISRERVGKERKVGEGLGGTGERTGRGGGLRGRVGREKWKGWRSFERKRRERGEEKSIR